MAWCIITSLMHMNSILGRGIMKRRCGSIAVLLFLAGLAMAGSQPSSSQHAAVTRGDPAGEWTLVWADEFNKDGRPDPNNWVYENGFVRNEELQWYQADNAVCKDGLLVIEARRERKPNPDYDPNSRSWRRNRQFIEYTSTCIKTIGRHSWTFGRFEMRGRIDTRPGMWPAFWTLGSARGWPGCGEIDIMEYYRGMLLANACWAGERTMEQRLGRSQETDHRVRRPRLVVASSTSGGWTGTKTTSGSMWTTSFSTRSS